MFSSKGCKTEIASGECRNNKADSLDLHPFLSSITDGDGAEGCCGPLYCGANGRAICGMRLGNRLPQKYGEVQVWLNRAEAEAVSAKFWGRTPFSKIIPSRRWPRLAMRRWHEGLSTSSRPNRKAKASSEGSKARIGTHLVESWRDITPRNGHFLYIECFCQQFKSLLIVSKLKVS